MRSIFFTLCLLFGAILYAQEPKDAVYHLKINASGTKMIPVYKGKYKVFTQKIGDGKIKLLLLHGGPENTHEYFENFPENLKQYGITIYYYDQLGSYFSDTPDDQAIWNINRFVEEVEEVRKGLNLDNFYLLGHSWGAMLAELYAAKYPKHLKGLILSNVPGFFAKDSQQLNSIIENIDLEVRKQTALLPKFSNNKTQMDSISKNMELSDPALSKMLTKEFNRTSDSLFGRTMYYRKYGKMPEALKRSFSHTRYESIEKYKFNPFGANYKTALNQIKTPTLLLGSKNDFVQPQLYGDLKNIMKTAKVRIFICPNGAHFPMWDDTEIYFKELGIFINEVESKSFKP